MPTSGASFTPATLTFLRALKRHNDREWFRSRKADYDLHVRAPMVAVIERLAGDFARMAPEMIADPRVNLYRIYRDTRFSADKSPLKTHVAAHFPTRGFARGEGAGLYVEVAPDGVWMGGGIYMPSSLALLKLREHIAANQRRFERIITARPFRTAVGTIQGERLTRTPRGFRADHPAAEHLKLKQFLAGRELPAAFATSPAFYRTLVSTFTAIVPLVRFLNDALDREPATDWTGTRAR